MGLRGSFDDFVAVEVEAEDEDEDGAALVRDEDGGGDGVREMARAAFVCGVVDPAAVDDNDDDADVLVGVSFLLVELDFTGVDFGFLLDVTEAEVGAGV